MQPFLVAMTRLAAAVTLALLAVLGGAPAAVPRTTGGTSAFLTVPGAIRQLAVGADRVAWIDPNWRLHVVALASRRQATIVYTQKRDVNQSDPFAQWPELAFAGSHPIWADARGTPEVLESVYSTDSRRRLRALARLRHHEGGGSGDYLLAIAGDASGGAYSATHLEPTPDRGGRNTGGGVWTVADGMRHRVPGLRPAVVLARSGSRLALAPTRTTKDDVALPEADSADPIVQIATVRGNVVATYHAQYEVQALAITPRYVFVNESRTDIDPVKGGTAILSASTGTLLRWLPGKGGWNMSANERYAAFSNSSKVFLLDGATGRITQVAAVRAAKSKIVNVVLDGKAIWWAVATQTPGSHGDETNPLDFTTTLYERAL
jgi:hypothetical protein